MLIVDDNDQRAWSPPLSKSMFLEMVLSGPTNPPWAI